MEEKYIQILKSNDLKVTHHRLAILRYLDTHRTHPTAFEIYQVLKKENPSLSKTTIYNALDTLTSHEIISKINITGSEHRYDMRNDSHHHFFCKSCGRIFDIDISCPNVEKVCESGHIVEEVHGYFKGICKECMEEG